MNGIEKIRAELKAASRVPWEREVTRRPTQHVCGDCGRTHDTKTYEDVVTRTVQTVQDDLLYPDEVCTVYSDEDATLIANAPTYLAALCDVAEAAQKVVDGWGPGIRTWDEFVAASNDLKAALTELDQ